MARDWKGVDLIKYFRDNYSHVTSREELKKLDLVFLLKLHEAGLIDSVVPSKNAHHRDWSVIDPLEYFQKNYSNIDSPVELSKKDPSLNKKLRSLGLLDKAFPRKLSRGRWKGIDIIQYFREHYSHIKTRRQLKKKNQSLYKQFLKEGSIGEVLPSKNLNHRDYADWNLNKYKEEIELLNFKTKAELRLKNRGLYNKGLREGWLDSVFSSIKCNYDGLSLNNFIRIVEEFEYSNKRDLFRKDSRLYKHARNSGWLDAVFPKSSGSIDSLLESYVEGDSNE